jgi:ribosome maturation factor RimP
LDKLDGRVSVEECALIAREVSSLLEVEDVIEGAFRLEISSPGIDRSLTRIEDFSKYKNFKVKVVKGNTTLKGELTGYSSKSVNILNKSGVSNIEIADIKDIKLDIDKMSFEKLKKMESL